MHSLRKCPLVLYAYVLSHPLVRGGKCFFRHRSTSFATFCRRLVVMKTAAGYGACGATCRPRESIRFPGREWHPINKLRPTGSGWSGRDRRCTPRSLLPTGQACRTHLGRGEGVDRVNIAALGVTDTARISNTEWKITVCFHYPYLDTFWIVTKPRHFDLSSSPYRKIETVGESEIDWQRERLSVRERGSEGEREAVRKRVSEIQTKKKR